MGQPDSDATRVDAKHAAEDPRFRWYFFKEAFSPALVTRAIADAGPDENTVVLDPFSGSGTVTLTAASLGHRALGLEVNPFLVFVSRAKVIRAAHESVSKGLSKVIKAARKGTRSPLIGFSTFSEKKGLSKWLFNSSVLTAFEGGWQVSASLDATAKDLLRLSLIGAAMDTCNAAKDGKCLRYRSGWEERRYCKADFVDALSARAEAIVDDLRALPLTRNLARIKLADARRAVLPKDFHVCVTSPPYLNSFDYTDVYRPELFLGKFVRTMDDLRRLRLRTLRSHVQVRWPTPTDNDFGQLYADSVADLIARREELWDSRIIAMVQAYFEDMKRVLVSLRKRAKENSSLWMVVSTSAYSGVEIPVDLILAEIGSRVGWRLREVSVLRYLSRVSCQQWHILSDKKNQRPHLRESLIVFDAGSLNGG